MMMRMEEDVKNNVDEDKLPVLLLFIPSIAF
jgi:hypothetical protein